MTRSSLCADSRVKTSPGVACDDMPRDERDVCAPRHDVVHRRVDRRLRGGPASTIVVRGVDADELDAAAAELGLVEGPLQGASRPRRPVGRDPDDRLSSRPPGVVGGWLSELGCQSSKTSRASTRLAKTSSIALLTSSSLRDSATRWCGRGVQGEDLREVLPGADNRADHAQSAEDGVEDRKRIIWSFGRPRRSVGRRGAASGTPARTTRAWRQARPRRRRRREPESPAPGRPRAALTTWWAPRSLCQTELLLGDIDGDDGAADDAGRTERPGGRDRRCRRSATFSLGTTFATLIAL